MSELKPIDLNRPTSILVEARNPNFEKIVEHFKGFGYEFHEEKPGFWRGLPIKKESE